ncbi:MAG: GMC family oxidoreductase [Gammaproteobacteria bacterium]|nr:GMC family oxidoreductase [Gammaproteobacteria bacterium]
MEAQFDAIVIGSGITGGWAAKELTERGLKVLMLERGRHIEHVRDYVTEAKAPWQMQYHGFGDRQLYQRDFAVQSRQRDFNEFTQHHFVNDRENPYQTDADAPFAWIRAYQLGGRSLIWGRQCYRWSDLDFEANRRDGHGSDWPIRYRDIAPWYDHVERFIGVSGSKEGLPQLPDGVFQPPMALSVVEAHAKQAIESRMPDRRLIIGRVANLTEPKEGRAPCQYRSICARGCSYGAYFSTQSSTLPAARATGNLTLRTDQVVERIEFDPQTQRASGVRVLDARTRQGATYTARMVFLCAGAFNSVAVLLRSASADHPGGLANGSGVLGRYIMDHANGLAAVGPVPGFEAHTTFGNRPTGIIVPRFRNVSTRDARFLRGYAYQGGAFQRSWTRGQGLPGLGAGFKAQLRPPGPWMFAFVAFAECLPRAENRLTLDPVAQDSVGLPQLRIRLKYGENEQAALTDAGAEAEKMIAAMGGRAVSSFRDMPTPGMSIHEMGGARMGVDPAQSVLDRHNRAHQVRNLFVTDGACMASAACQNPSLTYMALTARAADFAVSELKAGRL